MIFQSRCLKSKSRQRAIQEYITDDILLDYVAYGISLVSGNNFHTMMCKRGIRLYEFPSGWDVTHLTPAAWEHMKKSLAPEVQEISEHNSPDVRNG